MEQQPVVYLHAGERLELAVVTVGDVVGTTDWLPVVGTDDVTAGGDGLDTFSGVGDLGVGLPGIFTQPQPGPSMFSWRALAVALDAPQMFSNFTCV